MVRTTWGTVIGCSLSRDPGGPYSYAVTNTGVLEEQELFALKTEQKVVLMEKAYFHPIFLYKLGAKLKQRLFFALREIFHQASSGFITIRYP